MTLNEWNSKKWFTDVFIHRPFENPTSKLNQFNRWKSPCQYWYPETISLSDLRFVESFDEHFQSLQNVWYIFKHYITWGPSINSGVVFVTRRSVPTVGEQASIFGSDIFFTAISNRMWRSVGLHVAILRQLIRLTRIIWDDVAKRELFLRKKKIYWSMYEWNCFQKVNGTENWVKLFVNMTKNSNLSS